MSGFLSGLSQKPKTHVQNAHFATSIAATTLSSSVAATLPPPTLSPTSFTPPSELLATWKRAEIFENVDS